MAEANNWSDFYEAGLRAVKYENFDEAIEMFDLAIRCGADRWEPFYAHAWATLRDRGDDLEAIQDIPEVEVNLKQAVELGGPHAADAQALLGCLYAQRNDYAKAVSSLLQALGRTSQTDLVEERFVESFSAILENLEHEIASETSIQSCEWLEALVQATGLPPSWKNSLLAEIVATRAMCHQRLDQGKAAEECWRRLAQLAPGHVRLPQEFSHMGRRGSAHTTLSTQEEPSFEDVGGRDVDHTFQSRLYRIFETYFTGADLEAARTRIAEYGQKPMRSLLLFGPSGCGKTYIIRAFAGEYRRRYGQSLPVHRLRMNEIFNKYVGESEKALTQLFNEAILTQPSIIFADEIDMIGGARDSGQEWRTSQTAHLLQEFDRLQEQGDFVIVFGCTNRIWALDAAMIRRFDQLIPVELPNHPVRMRILDVQLRQLGPRVRPENLDLAALADASHGLTPGDIAKVIRQSVDEVLSHPSDPEMPQRLQDHDLLRALQEYRKPMHIRQWLRDSLQALQAAGHRDMAEDVERIYGPYVEPGEMIATAESTWRSLPEEAWHEEQEYDLNLVHLWRRQIR
jgi:tetratricopeptide (TPR) repeat protein